MPSTRSPSHRILLLLLLLLLLVFVLLVDIRIMTHLAQAEFWHEYEGNEPEGPEMRYH